MLGLLHAYIQGSDRHVLSVANLRSADHPRSPADSKNEGMETTWAQAACAGAASRGYTPGRPRGARSVQRESARGCTDWGAGRGGVHTWNIPPVFGTLDRSKRSCWLKFFAPCEPRVASRAHSVCGLCAG
jgi:hypothetical protein